MSTDEATAAPALKWHENGRYLNKDECLAQVVQLRQQAGRPAVLSPDEQNINLEGSHALLTTEMNAAYEATVQRVHERLYPPPSALRACVWFGFGALGLSAPHLLEAGVGPDWFQWLLKGSGGHGQSWQALGALALAVGLIEILTWVSERTGIAAFGFVSDCLRVVLLAGAALVALGFVALFGALMLGMISGWLSPFLPSYFGALLRQLDREPGSFILAGVIVLMIVGSVAVAYFRARSAKAEVPLVEVLSATALSAFQPFFLFTLIALKSFVWIFMILIALSRWSPFMGPWSPWIESNERTLVMYGVIASLLAPFPLHYQRTRRNRHEADKPTFSGSCWIVTIALSGLGLVVLVMTLAAAGLQSWK